MHGIVTFNLNPLKLVPPGTNFSEIFGPPPKNLFHYKGQHHEGKSVHFSGPEGTKENQHVRVRCWSLLLVTGSLKWYRETWSVAVKRTYDREQLVTNDEDKILDYNDQYIHFATFNFQKSACSSKAHSDISRNTVGAGC